MLKICEHFEYYNSDHLQTLYHSKDWKNTFDIEEQNHNIFFDEEQKQLCVSLKLGKASETPACSISSSYYIGLDCFYGIGLPVYIQPKVNNEHQQLNYIKMLFEALQEPENFEHLEGLVKVKFNEEWIEIENELQPVLTPFIIAQFLSVVKLLVRKGLKKSYYNRTENLSGRVKGKVLIGRQVKENILKNRLSHTICQYQEFGFDTEANQFLKYVLSIVPRHFEDFDAKGDIRLNLEALLRYCQAGFQQVSHYTFTELRFKESNPFYKQYNLAIQLGNQILALRDYNISRNAKQTTCIHPPFWIDMSKLFELYVFRKLREEFQGKDEVTYHFNAHQQELDFIINSGSFKAVVDAKYKPRYANGNPSIDDARQLSGYTRLNKVYSELEIDDDRLIPAYFVYPANFPTILQDEAAGDVEVFEELDAIEGRLLEGAFRKSTMYRQMYLQEIDLPIELLRDPSLQNDRDR